MTLGEKLRAERNMKGLSCRELAGIIGVSPSTIPMYERDERRPGDDIKVKYAAYFGTTVGALFFNESRHN